MNLPRTLRAALCALFVIACPLFAAAQTGAQPAAPAPPSPSSTTKKKLALVGGMLLDGYDGVPPVHRAAILIEGDRIVRVGPASEVAIPPDAQVIDTSGRVMM